MYNDMQHSGVKGMHWGVRKRKVVNVSSKKGHPQAKQGQRRMSNKELTNRVKRLKLEQEYAKLTFVPKPETKSKITTIVNATKTIAELSASAAKIYKSLNELGLVSSPKKGA